MHYKETSDIRQEHWVIATLELASATSRGIWTTDLAKIPPPESYMMDICLYMTSVVEF